MMFSNLHYTGRQHLQRSIGFRDADVLHPIEPLTLFVTIMRTF
jgi:hypothetical protein